MVTSVSHFSVSSEQFQTCKKREKINKQWQYLRAAHKKSQFHILAKNAKIHKAIVQENSLFWKKKFYFSSEICKSDRQKLNPKIFLLSDLFFYFFLIFKGFSTHKIFRKCRPKKSEPDISPILDFLSGIGKSDPQKRNLKVFLWSGNFFYIFQI